MIEYIKENKSMKITTSNLFVCKAALFQVNSSAFWPQRIRFSLRKLPSRQLFLLINSSEFYCFLIYLCVDGVISAYGKLISDDNFSEFVLKFSEIADYSRV